MTLPEAAASLGLAVSTLRNQIHAGRLKARKVGRDWHVKPREVERYRMENKAATLFVWCHVFRRSDEDHKARRADDSFDRCRCGQRIEKVER